MSRSPLVSVIMSVYKPDMELFPLAINSILAQTYSNFEFIIIDDGNSASDSQFVMSVAFLDTIKRRVLLPTFQFQQGSHVGALPVPLCELERVFASSFHKCR